MGQVERIAADVKVVIPADIFTNAAAAAANKWAKEDYIDSDSDLQWLLTFQQMHAWFQVREIDGKPTDWAEDWEDGLPKLSELRRRLADAARQRVKERFSLDAMLKAHVELYLELARKKGIDIT